MRLIRILFLADTHLGFDLPFRPRIARRRRGPDFFRNFRRALEPAHRGEVDAVIHGGDLLYRSKVPDRLVHMALDPLKEIADLGVAVFLVPGNHERSRIPCGLFNLHRNIHIFSHPTTFVLRRSGFTLALSGFPYWRNGVRRNFIPLVEEALGERSGDRPDARVLCLHHCFEGARVGPGNFTFRNGHDVIRTAEIHACFSAVLTGHVHRFQVLTRDLGGNGLNAPIFYPGSIERTSFAERNESKGCLYLELESVSTGVKPVIRWKFLPLPARPMVQLSLILKGQQREELRHQIEDMLWGLDPESVVKIMIEGHAEEKHLSVVNAASLRALSPPEMNISLGFPRELR